jgi:hypothetical protein
LASAARAAAVSRCIAYFSKSLSLTEDEAGGRFQLSPSLTELGNALGSELDASFDEKRLFAGGSHASSLSLAAGGSHASSLSLSFACQRT